MNRLILFAPIVALLTTLSGQKNPKPTQTPQPAKVAASAEPALPRGNDLKEGASQAGFALKVPLASALPRTADF
jgi:hypothetical protein